MMAAECVALRVCGLDERDDPDCLEAALRRQFAGVLAAHFLAPQRRSRLMLNGGAALLIVSSRVCARRILAAAKRPSFRLGGSAHVQIEWADENAARLRRESAKERKNTGADEARGDDLECGAENDAGLQLQVYENLEFPDRSEAGEGSTSGSQGAGERRRHRLSASSSGDEATSSGERCILPQKRKGSSAGYSWAHPDLGSNHVAEAEKRSRAYQDTKLDCTALSPREGNTKVAMGSQTKSEVAASSCFNLPSRGSACSPVSVQKSPRVAVLKAQTLWLHGSRSSPKAGRSALREIGNVTPRLASRQRSVQLKSPLAAGSPRGAEWLNEGELEQDEAWCIAKEVLSGHGWKRVAVGRCAWTEGVLEASLEGRAAWPEQIVTGDGLFCFSRDDFHDSVCAFQDAFQR